RGAFPANTQVRDAPLRMGYASVQRDVRRREAPKRAELCQQACVAVTFAKHAALAGRTLLTILWAQIPEFAELAPGTLVKPHVLALHGVLGRVLGRGLEAALHLAQELGLTRAQIVLLPRV